jgi:ATP-dependent Clp protease ATP-binding subunit ClpA
VNASPTLAPDTALLLGMASTALPFARTPEDKAERWLRVLFLHGEVGAVLTELKLSEGRLQASGENTDREPPSSRIDDRDAIEKVTEHATRVARQRGAARVATTDVLMAVMDVYGPDFDHVLQAHGTDRKAVVERLGTYAASRRG